MFISQKTMIRWLVPTLCLTTLVQSAMEPFIVGGGPASIVIYPHSAFLNVECRRLKERQVKWICGASIVNQQILLSAAHCIAGCQATTRIQVNVGSENKDYGEENSISSFLVHEDYDSRTSFADIGLLRTVSRLRLSLKISRVALMRTPPQNEQAAVAGWGLIDEDRVISSSYLKYINQTVKYRRDCLRQIGEIPLGCICGSSSKKSDYASSGDSGSALMVRGYIQIGIVSHKVPAIARNLIVYTDTAYYFNWIKSYVDKLFCA